MTIDIKHLDKVIGSYELYLKNNRSATKFSINQIVNRASREVLKEAKAPWKGILARDFKNGVTVTQATVSSLNAKWEIKTTPIGLIKFSASYRSGQTNTGRTRKGGAGVRYKLKTNQRKLSHSFIRKSKFGKKGDTVFTRKTSPNGAPITAKSAITPTSMLKQTKGTEEFITIFEREFPIRYYKKIFQMTKLKAI